MGPGGHTPPPGYMPPQSDPKVQIAWGLDYIGGSYGSADAALSFHNANNWYRRGGVVPGPKGTPQVIGAHGGERVLPVDLTDSFDRLAESINIWSNNGGADFSRAGDITTEDLSERVEKRLISLEETIERVMKNVGLDEPSKESIRESGENGVRRVMKSEEGMTITRNQISKISKTQSSTGVRNR